MARLTELAAAGHTRAVRAALAGRGGDLVRAHPRYPALKAALEAAERLESPSVAHETTFARGTTPAMREKERVGHPHSLGEALARIAERTP